MKVTVAFITGRAKPHLLWVLEGLTRQARPGDMIQVIVIDALDRSVDQLAPGFSPRATGGVHALSVTRPKPSIWQGPHRVTSCDWWAMSNARNTAFVLAEHDYIVFLDDACRLGDGWLEAVRVGYRQRASVIAGTYDKIESGRVTPDTRRATSPSGMLNCGGGWLFGCTFAMPLQWALEVNGFEEGLDGMGMEDCMFGLYLANNGRRIDFSIQLRVEQDRGELAGTNSSTVYKKIDKGVSPNDKSHAALDRFAKRRRTEFTPDLRALRTHMQRGGQWPAPMLGPDARDWYDGKFIREFIAP